MPGDLAPEADAQGRAGLVVAEVALHVDHHETTLRTLIHHVPPSDSNRRPGARVRDRECGRARWAGGCERCAAALLPRPEGARRRRRRLPLPPRRQHRPRRPAHRRARRTSSSSASSSSSTASRSPATPSPPRSRRIAERFGMTWSCASPTSVPRVAHPRLEAAPLPVRPARPLAPRRAAAEIPLVISNHPDRADIAAQFGVAVPRTCRSRRTTKAAQEARRARPCSQHDGIDLVVLARYMQVLSDGFVARVPEPHHQHPPLVPAGVRRRPALPPGPRARREDHRRHRPLRDRRARPGPDHRPGRRAASATATPSTTSSARAATSRASCSPAPSRPPEHRVLVYGNKTVVFG